MYDIVERIWALAAERPGFNQVLNIDLCFGK